MTLSAGELQTGVQLCREIRFPEQWHCLARQGAPVLIYLTYAANPAEPPGVWRAHLISRAAETQRFVLAANVAHGTQHCPTMIVSPRGQVLGEAPAGTAATLERLIDLGDPRTLTRRDATTWSRPPARLTPYPGPVNASQVPAH